MKTFLAITAALSLTVFAAPALKVTNRQFEDGGGSSKTVDPEKKQAIEAFIGPTGKLQYRIIYTLDDRLQAVSGIYYNALGKVFQKSTYRLDGADRIIQEVVYDANDRLVCTKNYIYGNYKGKSDQVVAVDIYDPNGKLVPTGKRTGNLKNWNQR